MVGTVEKTPCRLLCPVQFCFFLSEYFKTYLGKPSPLCYPSTVLWEVAPHLPGPGMERQTGTAAVWAAAGVSQAQGHGGAVVGPGDCGFLDKNCLGYRFVSMPTSPPSSSAFTSHTKERRSLLYSVSNVAMRRPGPHWSWKMGGS